MNHHELISSFTALITQANVNGPNNAMQFLCEHFDFDKIAIYETNQYNQFHIRSVYDRVHETMPASFYLHDISPKYQTLYKENAKLHIFEIDQVTKHTNAMCSFFNVNTVLIHPVVDQTKQILGFVILTKKLCLSEIFKADLDVFQTLITLFVMYASRNMYENKLSFAVQSLEGVMDNTGIDIYVNDFHNHDILYANKTMAAPYGGIQAFMGKKCYEALYPGQNEPCEYCPQKKIIDEDGNPTKTYTWDYERPFDGSWFRVFSSAFQWVDGRLAHVVSSADITDNKKQEALIHHMANYDALTNLPNRRMLVNDCEKRINGATKDEKGYILFFDIDGFKAINDNFGHDAGDEFLVQLGAYFSEVELLKDSTYRNGGDEFVAIIGGEDITKHHIQELINTLHSRFKKPWILKKGEVYCTTSVGVACFPEDGNTAEKLISIADQSMYMVKKQGGANVCFSCHPSITC